MPENEGHRVAPAGWEPALSSRGIGAQFYPRVPAGFLAPCKRGAASLREHPGTGCEAARATLEPFRFTLGPEQEGV